MPRCSIGQIEERSIVKLALALITLSVVLGVGMGKFPRRKAQSRNPLRETANAFRQAAHRSGADTGYEFFLRRTERKVMT